MLSVVGKNCPPMTPEQGPKLSRTSSWLSTNPNVVYCITPSIVGCTLPILYPTSMLEAFLETSPHTPICDLLLPSFTHHTPLHYHCNPSAKLTAYLSHCLAPPNPVLPHHHNPPYLLCTDNRALPGDTLLLCKIGVRENFADGMYLNMDSKDICRLNVQWPGGDFLNDSCSGYIHTSQLVILQQNSQHINCILVIWRWT